MFYLKICLTGTASLAPLSAPVTKTKRILQHTVITISRNIYLGTYAFTYSCTYVLMYSCTHVPCRHVPMYSAPSTHVPMYSVLMYTCTHVLMYSCTLIVNVRHTATASMSTKNISVYILYISGPANNLKNTSHTYSVSSSSSSR